MEVQFWRDKVKGLVEPELFSTTAEEFAKKIGEDGQGKKNRRTQLRKYYDEVLRLYGDIKTLREPARQAEKFDEILPYIKMIHARVMYAFGRGLVTESYKEFIRNGLNQVNDINDFRVFVNFLEAFMAFYKCYGPE